MISEKLRKKYEKELKPLKLSKKELDDTIENLWQLAELAINSFIKHKKSKRFQ